MTAVASVTVGACSAGGGGGPGIVARIDSVALTADRLAELLVLAQPLPLRQDVGEELARHWLHVAALARRLGSSASMTDSVTIAENMWLRLRQAQVGQFLAAEYAGRTTFDSAAVDSVFDAGRVRYLAHVLRRVDPQTSNEERLRQRQVAAEVYAQLRAGGDWAEANRLNQDDATREIGGTLGLLRRGQTEPRFESAAFALRSGEVSAVVETAAGYHVIYRPRLDQIRSVFARLVEPEVRAQFGARYRESVARDRNVAVEPQTPTEVRRLARDPWDVENATVTLATFDGGEITLPQLARYLRYLSPQTRREMLDAPAAQIMRFVFDIAVQEILWRLADSAGVQLSDTVRAQLGAEYRGAVTTFEQRIASSSDSAGNAPDGRASVDVAATVDRYFEAVAARRIPLEPMPPFLAVALLDGTDWAFDPEGVTLAVERARRLLDAAEEVIR